jgi:hypothetical protein
MPQQNYRILMKRMQYLAAQREESFTIRVNMQKQLTQTRKQMKLNLTPFLVMDVAPFRRNQGLLNTVVL